MGDRLTAISCNCEFYCKFTFSFRNNIYLSRKFAVPKFATDAKPWNVKLSKNLNKSLKIGYLSFFEDRDTNTKNINGGY